MALSQSAVSELLDALRSGDGVNLIRESVRMVMQELIEAEASEQIGAARYERAQSRVTQRNGSRGRLVSAQGGDVQLRIPKLRKGSFFPSILEPRRRIDQALYTVVMEAYVEGVSTRGVDDLVEAMGVDSGISKSEVSRICAGLDEVVEAFRSHTLGHVGFPYVYLDATYLHVRNEAEQVVSMAVVVATGITATGQREVLGLDIGDSEDEAFWKEFITSLKASSLSGVQLVISDQHADLLAHVPKAQTDYVAAGFRTIFAQTDAQDVARGVGQDPRGVRCPLPQARAADGRRQGRGAGVHYLPPRALAQGLVHQPVGKGEQRDQAQEPRGRDIPQRRRRHPTHRRDHDRPSRRVGRHRPPLPLRRIHGQTQR